LHSLTFPFTVHEGDEATATAVASCTELFDLQSPSFLKFSVIFLRVLKSNRPLLCIPSGFWLHLGGRPDSSDHSVAFAGGKRENDELMRKNASPVAMTTDSGSIMEHTASYLEPASSVGLRDSEFQQIDEGTDSLMEGSVVDTDYADRLTMKNANGCGAKQAVDDRLDRQH